MRLSFSQKLWLPLILSLVCLVGLSVIDAWHTREIRLDERKADLVHATELALTVVKTFADQAAAGSMTPASSLESQAGDLQSSVAMFRLA